MSYAEEAVVNLRISRAVAELVTFTNAEWVAYELISRDITAAKALYQELKWQLGENDDAD